MPIAACRNARDHLAEWLSNVADPPASLQRPQSGGKHLWRLVGGQQTGQTCDFGHSAGAGRASPVAGISKPQSSGTCKSSQEDVSLLGAALESLASAAQRLEARPPDVSLRCAAPQLGELLQQQPPESRTAGNDCPHVHPAAEASGATHRTVATGGMAGAVGPQPKAPKAPISSAGCREIDPMLARVIEAWPKLPRAIQAAIRTLAETGRGEP